MTKCAYCGENGKLIHNGKIVCDSCLSSALNMLEDDPPDKFDLYHTLYQFKNRISSKTLVTTEFKTLDSEIATALNIFVRDLLSDEDKINTKVDEEYIGLEVFYNDYEKHRITLRDTLHKAWLKHRDKPQIKEHNENSINVTICDSCAEPPDRCKCGPYDCPNCYWGEVLSDGWMACREPNIGGAGPWIDDPEMRPISKCSGFIKKEKK